MLVILAIQEGDQESHGLKPSPANSSWDPYLEKAIMDGGVGQGVGPEYKPQY
jgi:hypothetical protein